MQIVASFINGLIKEITSFAAEGFWNWAVLILAGMGILILLLDFGVILWDIAAGRKKANKESEIRRLWREGLQNYSEQLSLHEILQFCEAVHPVVKENSFGIAYSAANNKDFADAIDQYMAHGIIDCLGIFETRIRKFSFDLNIARKMTSQDIDLINKAFRAFHTETLNFVKLIEFYNANYRNYTDTDAFKQVAPSLIEALKTMYLNAKQAIASLDSLYDELASRVITDAPVPDTVKTLHTETAIDKVAVAARKCKSTAVNNAFAALTPKLSAYLDNSDSDQDLERRINSYYLPTLEVTLLSLSSAEKKKSGKVTDLERLCLKSMETIESILLSHEAAVDDATVRSVQVEVETMENLAMAKGDMTTENQMRLSLTTD